MGIRVATHHERLEHGRDAALLLWGHLLRHPLVYHGGGIYRATGFWRLARRSLHALCRGAQLKIEITAQQSHAMV